MLHNHHAHNSEEIPEGLEKALEAGFLNIEVDIHPNSPTQLLIGHDQGEAGANLQERYLQPLAERVAANGGTVYPSALYVAARIDSRASPLTLIVDVKEVRGQSVETSFDFVHQALAKFSETQPGLLVSWKGDDNEASPGAIAVMISGDRPAVSHLMTHYPAHRLAILDGREEDLHHNYPQSLVPVISKAWFCGVKAVLHGINPAQPNNKQVLQARALVQQAHSQQRQVRFWGHPDTPTGWQEMLDLGVDQISTDDFWGLSEWLTAQAADKKT